MSNIFHSFGLEFVSHFKALNDKKKYFYLRKYMHVGLSQMRLASWINKASTSDDNLILSMFVVIIYLILNSFENIQINRTINPAGERLSLMGGYFR